MKDKCQLIVYPIISNLFSDELKPKCHHALDHLAPRADALSDNRNLKVSNNDPSFKNNETRFGNRLCQITNSILVL